MRIAIDSGGTFTDCVALENGTLTIRKVFSTPDDPGRAILSCLEQLVGSHSTISVRHGTTIGTNAILERKGAKVAFVTTEGFEDALAIGRQARHSLYDWSASPEPPIVPAERRFGVAERTSEHGVILRSPSADDLVSLRESIAKSGAEAIALSLLFSFANSANEECVTRALEGLGLPLSVSHRILPEFREYERGSTVAINAYLQPKVGRYLEGLARSLSSTFSGTTLHVMQSSGGIVAAATAAEEPVRTVLSGPAGGVIGAHRVALQAGFDKVIAFDMGGTSTDVSLVDTRADGPRITNESIVAGMPVAVPMLEIHTVGAGGGSLARFDQAGALHVGPESAGSVPGPICYGKGERPTVTDANLLLGRLDPDNFWGGGMRLDEQRTRLWTEKVCGSLGSPEAFAAGVLQLAEASIEKAIRVISVERGYDPREFTLLAFGGAGPLHACSLARALSIPRVLVPRMPGALSALGILLSDIVRDYSKTVMLPFEIHSSALLEQHFRELEMRGSDDLAGEGLTGQITRSADLRYAGQGYEVNVPFSDSTADAFHTAHEKRYGYADPARPVEVVNVRVRFTVAAEPIESSPEPPVAGDGRDARLKMRLVRFGPEAMETPVYAREKLRPGDRFAGPALVTEYSATTVVSPGDRLEVDTYGNLIIDVQPSKPAHRVASGAESISPIDLSVFQSATHSIAEEMGAALRRTSFSPNIKERRDYSCAVFDGDGEVIAMGDHMPVHLGSMPMSVRAAIDALQLEPGDIALLNDPYHGGTHLPDLTMVTAVYAEGEPRPAFYAATRAHHADVGGRYPGSMGLCREIYQEGLRIPPVKLVRGGAIDSDLLRMVLHNVRTPVEREGDLNAQIGACRVGAIRLAELITKYKAAGIRALASELLNYSERLTRAEIAKMPAGTFEAMDYLDGDGESDTPIRIQVRIEIDPVAASAHLDFAGSSPQAATSVNAVLAVTRSAAYYVFRCLMPADAPATAGLMRPVTLSAPEGSIVHAISPAPVAAGNVETSQRTVDVLLRALAKAIPARIPAASSGTMTNLTIGGLDPRKSAPFAYYETTAGGMGARPQADGLSGVHTHMTNSLNTPVEALEYAYPFRVRRYAYRRGSGGSGLHRGGDGIVRELELLADAQVTLIVDRQKIPPYGLNGGEPGAPARVLLTRGEQTTELPGKCSMQASRGDVIRLETPGGGGWGDPVKNS